MRLTEKPKLLGLAFLLIPFMVIALMIVQSEKGLRQQEYRFKIEGYDPRDLLHGHYLTFRYVLPQEMEKECSSENCCLYLEGAPPHANMAIRECNAPVESNVFLKLDQWQQMPAALNRYYIPEKEAAVLDDELRMNKRNFEVGLVILPDHTGQIKMLYVDGQPLPEFLKSLPKK